MVATKTNKWIPSQSSSGYYRKPNSGKGAVEYIKYHNIPASLQIGYRWSVGYKKGKMQRNLGMFKTLIQARKFVSKYIKK